jgi:hypothetical protein
VQRLDDDLHALPHGRPKRLNRIEGEPAGHAAWFLDAYQLFALGRPEVSALVLIDDADGGRSSDEDAARAEAHVRRIQQDKTEGSRGPAAAFGVAAPTAEGWLLLLCGRPAPRSADAAKRALRVHLGMPAEAKAAPVDETTAALAGCSPATVNDPGLARFWSSLCAHVAPAVLG